MFALNYQAQSITDANIELGVRIEKKLAVSDGFLNFRGRAAWVHDYNPDSTVTAGFEALPGATFVVSGARPYADAARVSAGIERSWFNGFSLAATFDCKVSGNTDQHGVRAFARYFW